MAERSERTKADVRGFVVYLGGDCLYAIGGFPVSLYNRKNGQNCRSIKRIDVSTRRISLINLISSYVYLMFCSSSVFVKEKRRAAATDFKKSFIF